MTQQLPVPEELQHLIEKRSGKDRRKSASQPKGPGPSGASTHSTSADPPDKPPESRPDRQQERRSGRDRRRSASPRSTIDPAAGSCEGE